MTRRILVLAMLCITLFVGGYGCMWNKKQNINDVALAYMEQKYGEPFMYESSWGGSKTGVHEMYVRCDSFPNQRIFVEIENYNEDNRVFSDNYLAAKYEEELTSFFLEYAVNLYGEANVFYKVARISLSPDLSADASFDDYLADTCGAISACIELRASSFTGKEPIEKMLDRIVSICKTGNFMLAIVFVEDALFGSFDNDTLRKNVVRGQFTHCARATRTNDTVRLEWLGGMANE